MYLCPLCLIPTDADRCTEGHHPTVLIPGLDDSWTAGVSIQKSRASRVSKCFQGDFRRAIKVIDPNGFDRPDDAHELFSRERATLTQLAHSHVIALIHAEEVSGRLCLITEYVPRTLEDVLRTTPERRLALPRAVHLAAQLADALAYMHDVGVIHRDLKPENLGLDDRDHLYVFDFGLAGVRRGDSATTVGVKGFSRPYAAPEQLDSKAFGRDGPWSDLYALGAILYELIAGRSHRPQGLSGGYEAYARQSIPPLPPDPARPAALDRLILRCLAVEAGARPRDTWAVLDAVAELADRLGTGLGEAHARFVQVETGLAAEQAALAEAQASVAEARVAVERIAKQARTEQTAQRRKLAEERAAATDALARELASQRAAAEASLAEARASADRLLKHAKLEERAQKDRLAAERAAAVEALERDLAKRRAMATARLSVELETLQERITQAGQEAAALRATSEIARDAVRSARVEASAEAQRLASARQALADAERLEAQRSQNARRRRVMLGVSLGGALLLGLGIGLVVGASVGGEEQRERVDAAPPPLAVDAPRPPLAADAAPPSLAVDAAPPPTPAPGALLASATPQRPALRFVPAGESCMGSPDGKKGHCHAGAPAEQGRDDDEVPHEVTLTQALWVMETEVTQGQWSAVLKTRPSYFAECGDTCPVERVSWYEAVAFANALSAAEGLTPAYRVGKASGTLGGGLPADKLWADGDFQYASVERVAGADGYRLPTEAEWEWLARAGTPGAIYAGTFEILGENNAPALDALAWYAGNSGLAKGYDSSGWKEMQRPAKFSGTHPVGQKAANAWGLRDVLGNVWEWCEDAPVAYPKTPRTDPSGPLTGDRRVVRGGSWDTFARWVRSANRFHSDPVWRGAVIGFRLVRPPSSVEP